MPRFGPIQDCVECGSAEQFLTTCEICGQGICAHCKEHNTKQCAGCGRVGCKAHFNGMFCHECIEVERTQSKRAAGKEVKTGS